MTEKMQIIVCSPQTSRVYSKRSLVTVYVCHIDNLRL